MKFNIQKSNAEQPFHVVIVGDNGEPMFTSENLSSKENCHNAIEAVQRGALTAEVHDLTEEDASL